MSSGANPLKRSVWPHRPRGLWLAVVTVAGAMALALPATSPASGPVARAALRAGDVIWIEPDSRMANGVRLRVAIAHAGVLAAAVLQAPENRPAFPNRRRAQQWKLERLTAVTSTTWRPYAFRIRNVYSDKCLTAARPHASPVYLQNCGDILGQAWGLAGGQTIYSLNYNQTFPLGCPCKALDIPNYRNVPGTQLVVANHAGTWNQQWLGPIVPASLR
jgi:hypothetical protein